MTEPDDMVAVESLCYFGFLSLIKMLSRKAVELNTDPREGISFDSLEKLVRHKKVRLKALLLNPNVHNPLGSIMPDEKKRQIPELINKGKAPVIEDDTYGDLVFDSPHDRRGDPAPVTMETPPQPSRKRPSRKTPSRRTPTARKELESAL